jgi:hypothetical protein
LARECINQTATFTLTLERGQWTQSFNFTVVVTEPEGDETVFEYALEGDAIRISFKNTDPQQMCRGDAKCAGGVIVWQSAPYIRV